MFILGTAWQVAGRKREVGAKIQLSHLPDQLGIGGNHSVS